MNAIPVHPFRTRIAPTPSGYLHLGNAFSFLLTAAFARRHNGSLLLRIDDIDIQRRRTEYLDDIFETLSFLQVDYQSGPVDSIDFLQHYSQHLRLVHYQVLLEKLVQTGLVYACICSRKSLTEKLAGCNCKSQNRPLYTEDAAWRITVPKDTLIRFTDDRMGSRQVDLAVVMPDFIIRKRDGLPAYQVASLADDLYFGINYIVRGEDLLPSTAAQLYLARLLKEKAFLQTRFYHHALLKNPAGAKLSKSAGDLSVKALRQQGMTLDDLIEKMIPVKESHL